jgi:uncharacterized protein YydD (DUF2326 family)
MKLVKLSANKASFREVRFNPSGVTLILGKESGTGEKKKTYNGVGKSLIIRLVDFCLGCKKIDALEISLPGWEFTLTFRIGNTEHTASRATLAQSAIVLDGKEMKLDEYKKFLEDRVFEIGPNLQLSFRSLISRFLRQGKGAYTKPEIFVPKEQAYNCLLNNGFLLGLDPKLIKAKRDKKKELDDTFTKKQNFDKDPILHEFYSGTKDADLELQALDEKIAALDKNLAAFDVAEDYHQIRTEADSYSRRTRELENDAVVFQNAISNIEQSLRYRPDIEKEKVIRLYEEANFHFSDKNLRKIDEVLEFQATLIANRKRRLLEEKKYLSEKLLKVEEERKQLGKKLDDALKYLNSHRALDDFVAVSNHRNDLKSRAGKIRDYKQLIKQYELKLDEIEIDLKKQSIEAQGYLDLNQEALNRNVGLFRILAKRIYQEKQGRISISNNDGENQLRFNIEAKIQDDASDGINEVKIFCFDLTILLARQGHKIDFLFHDSRLFADIDYRQRESLFRIAHEYSKEKGFQYIASVNEDQLNSFGQDLTETEYKEIISNNITLELTDESPGKKLLGIEIDMDYE